MLSTRRSRASSSATGQLLSRRALTTTMAAKPPLLYSRERGRRRAHCCYCKRDLAPAQPERSTSMTFDHVRAESAGGWKKVPCCRKCNNLKDDLSPEDWFWFIATHPRWRKEFTLCSQVKRIVREFRWAQAQAGEREIDKYRRGAEARQ